MQIWGSPADEGCTVGGGAGLCWVLWHPGLLLPTVCWAVQVCVQSVSKAWNAFVEVS